MTKTDGVHVVAILYNFGLGWVMGFQLLFLLLIICQISFFSIGPQGRGSFLLFRSFFLPLLVFVFAVFPCFLHTVMLY